MQMSFILVLILLFLVSCSSSTPKTSLPKVDPLYRPPESREEYLRRLAIERYRALRLEYLNRPAIKKRSQSKVLSKKTEFFDYQVKPQEVQAPILEDPAVLQKRREDREAEIMQNIDLYCIKKQDSAEFNSTADCKEFCTNALLDCESEVENGFERKDRSLVICIKNRLSR
ncbi:MAG: hypothetical protein A2381_14530 [Bdellovibrionales bacterium RIFOXYB1_FULL_37_110]|nr:MAG: hypothetical protein A2417_03190 [Bdellovibrionales bacterium RIFOXYC1_FULL_37_79]OFZ58356.1 MAG: hypothetical protein A2381_14530 [Bdellovibrionales bacterium RIFOXYB1_FULL_37_110]OFZ62694.1 MAG: hypothetical protein A2577_02240 [Bdellovibrionales bacterium RIFOXYD1_FULL_36_51]